VSRSCSISSISRKSSKSNQKLSATTNIAAAAAAANTTKRLVQDNGDGGDKKSAAKYSNIIIAQSVSSSISISISTSSSSSRHPKRQLLSTAPPLAAAAAAADSDGDGGNKKPAAASSKAKARTSISNIQNSKRQRLSSKRLSSNFLNDATKMHLIDNNDNDNDNDNDNKKSVALGKSSSDRNQMQQERSTPSLDDTAMQRPVGIKKEDDGYDYSIGYSYGITDDNTDGNADGNTGENAVDNTGENAGDDGNNESDVLAKSLNRRYPKRARLPTSPRTAAAEDKKSAVLAQLLNRRYPKRERLRTSPLIPIAAAATKGLVDNNDDDEGDDEGDNDNDGGGNKKSDLLARALNRRYPKREMLTTSPRIATAANVFVDNYEGDDDDRKKRAARLAKKKAKALRRAARDRLPRPGELSTTVYCATKTRGNDFKNVPINEEEYLDDVIADNGKHSDKIWNEKFRQLLVFKERFKISRIPVKYAEDPVLGSWVQTQRGYYKTNSLHPNRVKRLNSVGFIWSLVDGPSWMDMYKRLLAFNKQHGHVFVPKRHPDDPQLGTWVRHQRAFYNHQRERLPQDRIDLLEAVDFAWNVREMVWMKRYKELIAYKKENGHTVVPVKSTTGLGDWINSNRQYRKKNIMTEKRIDLLNKVDFIWTVRSQK